MQNQLSFKCLLILLNLQNVVQSFRLYQLNDLSEDQFIKKLRNIVKSNEKPPPTNNILDFIEQDMVFDSEQKNNVNVRTTIYSGRKSQDGPKKPVLVKRIIPHDYKMGKYEYDSKFGTIYRPLIRVHVKKPMSEVETDIINSKPANRSNVFIILLKNRNSPKNLVQQIKGVINKKLNYGKIKQNSLRAIFDKSGEELDPYRPWKRPSHETVKVVTAAPNRKPDFPFWNYWTYDKTVHEDDCPDHQIKLGNVCLGMINI